MTEQQYVKRVGKKITCSKERKMDIEKQLLADLNERIQNGTSVEDAIKQMGTVEQVAEAFNETISDKEKKEYKKAKRTKTLVIIFAALAAFILFVYWASPKTKDIEKSKIFDAQTLNAAIEQTIHDVECEDYESLKSYSIERMQTHMIDDQLADAKKQIAEDWGAEEKIGTPYMAELTQMGKVYAVCQVSVTYENTSVTYTFTYDKDMKLAGLFMK